MKRGWIVACVIAALAGSAAAEPRLQVLQSDGRADPKIRARIDAGILALARAGGAQVIPGDITFTDAAAAVGCRAEDAACRDEVLGMLAVDEIVITTVSPKPGGFEVAVRRVGKGGVAREATSFVAHDQLDKLDTIAPLFAPPEPVATPAAVTTTTPPTPPPSEVAASDKASPPAAPPAAEPRPPAQEMRLVDPYPGIKYREDRPRGRSRAALVGIIGGGAMALTGVIFWASAASVQGQIDAAPVSTKEQLRALQDLERKGDDHANAGNLFMLGGLVLGGVSTYYFLKSGRRRTSTARLYPTVLPGGGGIAFVLGGSP